MATGRKGQRVVAAAAGLLVPLALLQTPSTGAAADGSVVPRPASASPVAAPTEEPEPAPGPTEEPEPAPPSPTTSPSPTPTPSPTPSPAPATSPQGKVVGRVVDPRGAGVAGAKVVLFTLDWTYVREVKARRSGHFTFTVAPGRYRLQVRDGRPAWDIRALALRDASVTIRRDETTVTVVRMRRGAYVTGRVSRGPKRQAARRALVRANDRSGRTFEVRTDRSGGFALGGLPPGTYRLWANDAQHQWVGPTVVVRGVKRGRGTDVRIAMRTRAGGINGYVMEGGRIARNPTWVTAVHRGTGQWWNVPVRNGDLSLRGLRPGRYEFTVKATREYAGRTFRPRAKVRSGRTRHLVLRLDKRLP